MFLLGLFLAIRSKVVVVVEVLNWKDKQKQNTTHEDHPKQGGRAQTSPRHQAKMRSPLALEGVIFLEYCIGLTIAKYL